MLARDMRIGVFFTYGVSLESWSKVGILDRETLLYNKLNEYGINFSLFTYGNESDLNYQQYIPNIRIVPLHPSFLPFNSKLIKFLYSLIIPFLFSKEISMCDILKTNQMWGSWVPLICKKIFSKPLYLRMGYEHYMFSIHQKRSKSLLIFIRLVSHLAYNNSNEISVTSNEQAKFIKKKFNIKTTVRYNWIDIDHFAPNKIRKTKEFLLAVGRLEDQKNYSILIKALSNSGIQLVIIGSGSLKGKLEIEGLKYGVNVSILERVANSEIIKYYSSCLIYLITSNNEGNPKTLLEAMACGSPVIGTNVTGIRNIIRNNYNGLLVDSKPEAIKAAINLLLENKPLRKYLSSNARQYIIQNCSLRNYVINEYFLYKKLLPIGKIANGSN